MGAVREINALDIFRQVCVLGRTEGVPIFGVNPENIRIR
jgi:hypothetical protein